MKDLEKQLEEFTGDKRTKEYKDLKNSVEFLKTNTDAPQEDTSPDKEYLPVMEEIKKSEGIVEPFDRKIYDRVMSYRGRIPREDVQKFFEDYNRIFGTNKERCNCPGKVAGMVAKLKGTYNVYLRKLEKYEKEV